MPSLYRFLAGSDHWVARVARRVRHGLRRVCLPAPRVLVVPVLWLFLFLRGLYFSFKRVVVCEPLLKAYCKKYGWGLRADAWLPWITGAGDLILGDNVLISGKLNVGFGARFADRPTLQIGDRTDIGHDCAFTVGKRIIIGRDCLIGPGVCFFDSPGHPTSPAARLAGDSLSADQVRPIVVGDNVWIGRACMIFPGVTIGDGSVVSAGSVVMTAVPPNTLVGGNPARKMAALDTAPVKENTAAPGNNTPIRPTEEGTSTASRRENGTATPSVTGAGGFSA
jgi:acetyltransferase-like isoleucine patch superfamily enzyme